MPSSLTDGWGARFLRVSRKFTILAGTSALPGRFLIQPKANPSTCTKGELNVGTDGKLYVCSADDTWTVAGSQS